MSLARRRRPQEFGIVSFILTGFGDSALFGGLCSEKT